MQGIRLMHFCFGYSLGGTLCCPQALNVFDAFLKVSNCLKQCQTSHDPSQVAILHNKVLQLNLRKR